MVLVELKSVLNMLRSCSEEIKMFGKEDNTYNDIREKTIHQWLDEISSNENIVVRGGVKVTKDYLIDLKKKIASLENENALKDKYLRKLKSEKR